MSDTVREAVDEFKKMNGNRDFTTKELVIYFNAQQVKSIDEIKETIKSLPCEEHVEQYNKMFTKLSKEINKVKIALNTEVTERKTTNRNITYVIGIGLTVTSLVLGYIHLG